MMRVIGGHARGRRLKVPKGQSLRPTAARVKESLFNILPRDLSGAKVLDLFAGTGNVSIEALSRGAAAALLVDSSTGSAKAIRENLRRLDLADRSEIWTIPVLRAVKRLARRGETFDFIFLDPPYEQNWVGSSLKAIAEGSLLRPSGILVAEHSVREKLQQRYGLLIEYDQRKYGSTLLSFFRMQAPNPNEGLHEHDG
jgi:16S rRNA (guanine(966)-N(2))-methyltransferase RsmD